MRKKFTLLVTSILYICYYVIYSNSLFVKNKEFLYKLDKVDGIGVSTLQKVEDFVNYNSYTISKSPNVIMNLFFIVSLVVIIFIFYKLLSDIKNYQDEYHNENMQETRTTQQLIVDE